MDEEASRLMAPMIGASTDEVAIMQTLTANLHLLLLSFYKPTKEKFKIMIESKAFPSDHFVAQSQLAQHGIATKDGLVLVEPSDPDTHNFSTQHVLDTIDKHADSLAIIVLPGIQFYTGQLFDIKTITEHAHSKGIIIGWDLAHAAGNVPLKLHDWNVDFAVWCTYKYLNSGPGSSGGIFVHDNHGSMKNHNPDIENGQLTGGIEAEQAFGFRHRLAGWWGSRKDTRFNMSNIFVPIDGARGWQISNPSALDLSSVIGSLNVFGKTNIETLRRRSIRLTAYLEFLLLKTWHSETPPYVMLTPQNKNQRGAQISVRLNPGLLEGVLEHLEENGVVIDERKPDVIRVAPAPLYNTYADVENFVKIFFEGLKRGGQ
jgi:kynureninase